MIDKKLSSSEEAVQHISTSLLDFFNKHDVPPDIAVDSLCTALAVVLATTTSKEEITKTCSIIAGQLGIAINNARVEGDDEKITH